MHPVEYKYIATLLPVRQRFVKPSSKKRWSSIPKTESPGFTVRSMKGKDGCREREEKQCTKYQPCSLKSKKFSCTFYPFVTTTSRRQWRYHVKTCRHSHSSPACSRCNCRTSSLTFSAWRTCNGQRLFWPFGVRTDSVIFWTGWRGSSYLQEGTKTEVRKLVMYSNAWVERVFVDYNN